MPAVPGGSWSSSAWSWSIKVSAELKCIDGSWNEAHKWLRMAELKRGECYLANVDGLFENDDSGHDTFVSSARNIRYELIADLQDQAGHYSETTVVFTPGQKFMNKNGLFRVEE